MATRVATQKRINALLVLDDSICVREASKQLSKFYAKSCGQVDSSVLPDDLADLTSIVHPRKEGTQQHQGHDDSPSGPGLLQGSKSCVPDIQHRQQTFQI